ncbi:MAG: sialidase family protein, partial [Cyclobacteriaceae bacterium]
MLFSDDHTSEGFLVPLKDGKMLLIFRLDPGIEGDHVGRRGFIAKIRYDPEQDQWGKVETVYNSHQYDDRNIHGGVTSNGRIVVFFRQYDGSNTEGRYFIYSDDQGQTWSEPQINKLWSDPLAVDRRGNMSTGQMFYNPDIKKYMMLGFIYSWDENREYTFRGRCISYSQDGKSWDDYSIVTDTHDFRLNEISGTWCGKNRIIAFQRDDEREHGHPFVQVESHDNGKTWTDPVPTNIPPDQHWGAAPQLIYDQNRNLLIALGSDRYSRPDEENGLFIFTAHPDEVIGNPEGWKLQHELARPLARPEFAEKRPLNFNFYGYATIAPINE